MMVNGGKRLNAVFSEVVFQEYRLQYRGRNLMRALAADKDEVIKPNPVVWVNRRLVRGRHEYMQRLLRTLCEGPDSGPRLSSHGIPHA
jgi:hypothetical protein